MRECIRDDRLVWLLWLPRILWLPWILRLPWVSVIFSGQGPLWFDWSLSPVILIHGDQVLSWRVWLLWRLWFSRDMTGASCGVLSWKPATETHTICPLAVTTVTDYVSYHTAIGNLKRREENRENRGDYCGVVALRTRWPRVRCNLKKHH